MFPTTRQLPLGVLLFVFIPLCSCARLRDPMWNATLESQNPSRPVTQLYSFEMAPPSIELAKKRPYSIPTRKNPTRRPHTSRPTPHPTNTNPYSFRQGPRKATAAFTQLAVPQPSCSSTPRTTPASRGRKASVVTVTVTQRPSMLVAAQDPKWSNTCGYVNGNPRSPKGCPAGSRCMTSGKYVGCGSGQSTAIPAACEELWWFEDKDRKKVTPPPPQPGTLTCSEKHARYCQKYTYYDPLVQSNYVLAASGKESVKDWPPEVLELENERHALVSATTLFACGTASVYGPDAQLWDANPVMIAVATRPNDDKLEESAKKFMIIALSLIGGVIVLCLLAAILATVIPRARKRKAKRDLASVKAIQPL